LAMGLPMSGNFVDFRKLQQQALPYLPAIVHRLLPGGCVEGREYVSRNPRRADRRPGSFKVNLITGKWADFAAGVSGGDAASLVAYLLGVSQSEAAAWLLKAIGGAA